MATPVSSPPSTPSDATGTPGPSQIAGVTGATDERLTTVGLLFESAAGLRRLFGRQLDDSSARLSQWFDILIRLARSDGFELRMSELAAQASLTPSGLTRAVDRLQEQGLVVPADLPRGPARARSPS